MKNEAVEQLESLFTMLHDGSIASATQQEGDLILTIDCQYLAELIDPGFERFVVRLNGLEWFAFDPWTDPGATPVAITALDRIIDADLEILSAESTGDTALITCKCWNADEFKGGHLSIRCADVALYDQNGAPLSLETLRQYCRQYWERFDTK